MVYQTYTTTAIVCGSWPRNGADKIFLLFTRELGMLYATARSVREERSRQRYALQECASVRVSLVRGRLGWRIGSVIDISHPVLSAKDRQRRIAIVRLLRTVRRFLPGESPVPNVFDTITHALEHLVQTNDVQAEVFTVCTQFKVLYELGYIAPTAIQQTFLTMPPDEIQNVVSEVNLEDMQRSIDNASAVSHL